MYTYAENNPVNFNDPSGYGIWSSIKNTAKKAVSAAKTVVKKAVTVAKAVVKKVTTVATQAVATTKKVVTSTYKAATTAAKKTVQSVSSYAKQKVSSAYTAVKKAGSAVSSLGKNMATSWSAALEKTMKHVCTTANRIQKNVVEFVQNVDWKKVAIGVGVTLAVAGLAVATGGIGLAAAGPVLMGAAMGAGTGAVISGGIAAAQGGSIADVAKAASDGFMWGAIGGAVSGGSTALLDSAVKSGSKAATNTLVVKSADIAADTSLDIVQDISRGNNITIASVGTSLLVNTVLAGNKNGSGVSAKNQIADNTQDSASKSVKNSGSFEEYMKMAETLDVSTKPNTATFYSGKGNRELAESFAKDNGKTTLEMTSGGKYLDDLKLFSEDSSLTKEQASTVWKKFSERYALGASGNAYGFTEGANPGSIFNTIEYPALQQNSNVTNVFTELLKK